MRRSCCILKLLTVCFLHILVHLVDIWNMIEAFRDNGLNTLDHTTEISVSRLETVISSIYYQLNKRLPSTHQISVEQSISLLLNFMIAAYDRPVPGLLVHFNNTCLFVTFLRYCPALSCQVRIMVKREIIQYESLPRLISSDQLSEDVIY